MKKAVHIIMIARQFLGDHPSKGEPTNFKEKILKSEKITTVRSGEKWEKVVEDVNAGLAVLQLREWSGAAYRSKQHTICQFDGGIGYQTFEIKEVDNEEGFQVFIDGRQLELEELPDVAHNDGLGYVDFLSWFKFPAPFKGGIIHFSKFKY